MQATNRAAQILDFASLQNPFRRVGVRPERRPRLGEQRREIAPVADGPARQVDAAVLRGAANFEQPRLNEKRRGAGSGGRGAVSGLRGHLLVPCEQKPRKKVAVARHHSVANLRQPEQRRQPQNAGQRRMSAMAQNKERGPRRPQDRSVRCHDVNRPLAGGAEFRRHRRRRGRLIGRIVKLFLRVSLPSPADAAAAETAVPVPEYEMFLFIAPFPSVPPPAYYSVLRARPPPTFRTLQPFFLPSRRSGAATTPRCGAGGKGVCCSVPCSLLPLLLTVLTRREIGCILPE